MPCQPCFFRFYRYTDVSLCIALSIQKCTFCFHFNQKLLCISNHFFFGKPLEALMALILISKLDNQAALSVSVGGFKWAHVIHVVR